jgi:hypothetical protein
VGPRDTVGLTNTVGLRAREVNRPLKTRGGKRVFFILVACFLACVAPRPTSSQQTPRDVVLEALREVGPRTPLQTIRAVENLLNIGEVELAKSYLSTFIKNPPSEETLVKLHDEMGSTFFSKIAMDRRFSPEGQQLASLILSAATRAARDPKQLKQWTLDLESDKYDVRRTAIANLQNAGPDGVVAILQRAADAKHQPPHQAVTDALWSLGKISPGPLQGAVRCDDPHLRLQALSAMARNPGPNRLTLLRWELDPLADPAIRELSAHGNQSLTRQPSNLSLAAGLMRQEAGQLLDGTKHLGDIDTFRWTLWYWTAKTLQAEAREFPRRTAELIVASQIAEDLIRIQPDHETNHELYWTAVLAATRKTHPFPAQLKQVAPDIMTLACQSPVQRLENVIKRGLQGDLAPAAIGACEALLHSSSPPTFGTGSAVSMAAGHPNRRLRFAAARLAMHWAPTRPYGAASDVWEEVLRALRTGNGRTVLILDSMPQRGESLAAYCRQFNLDAMVMSNGQDAVRAIQTHNSVDAILIHQALSSPIWSEMWQQLQSMPTAMEIPTALLYQAEGFRQSDSDRIAIEQMGTTLLWYPAPSSATALGTLIRRMLENVEAPMTQDERIAMAREALTWVQRVAADSRQHELYDLGLLLDALEATAKNPDLAQGSISALAALPSERAQQILRTVARNASLSQSLRDEASTGLRASTERFGMKETEENP